jgi:hypothetical protein
MSDAIDLAVRCSTKEMPAMQHALRPYATAGIALVGASVIAVTPMAIPKPSVQTRPVQLVDAWSDLLTDTTTNVESIVANADPTAISGVFHELFTNPLGVLDALTDLTPTVSADLLTTPADISVTLPPALELVLAGAGRWGATVDAIHEVIGDLQSDPSDAFKTLLEAPATILNAALNGHDEVSLLGGIIDITGFNGILAPAHAASIDINLPNLLDALGLGNQSIGDLSGLLGQLGLGNIGGLFSDLGIGNDGLGTLLGDTTLSSLLGDLGVGDLGVNNIDLSTIVSSLGLDGNVSGLSLTTVLDAFGLNDPINTTLGGLLGELGLGSVLNESVGALLPSLPSNLLDGALSSLNGTIGTLLGPILGNSLLTGLLGGLNLSDLLSVGNLETALSGITIGNLLGDADINTTVGGLLSALDLTVPDNLSAAGILTDLDLSAATGNLSLDSLLTAFGVGGSDLTGALNTVDLSDLLTGLGISGTGLDLTNLGDLSLTGLLSDLNIGDLASIHVQGFGGLLTELIDVIPQQIMASLGG